MALSTRQTALYTHTFSLWKPSTLSTDSNGAISDPSWPTTPTYTGVSGYYQSTSNINEPKIPGQTKQANIFTADHIHFAADQDIASGWLVKMTGNSMNTTDSNIGKYWTVQGPPDSNARRANRLMAYIIETPTPRFS